MKKLLLFIFLLAPLFAVAQTRIEVDPQTVVGDIKPMLMIRRECSASSNQYRRQKPSQSRGGLRRLHHCQRKTIRQVSLKTGRWQKPEEQDAIETK